MGPCVLFESMTLLFVNLISWNSGKFRISCLSGRCEWDSTTLSDVGLLICGPIQKGKLIRSTTICIGSKLFRDDAEIRILVSVSENLSFLLGMLPVTVTTKDDIRTSLVQVGLPKSLYFLLPSWEWWLVSPMFAPKFFKSSIFTSILGWRDEGIDPPTLTARRWWLGAGRSDPWELGSFKKCWGWGPNLFTKKPGAVFEAQPDSGRKAGGKMKHPNWNRNFELWTMFFLEWNFILLFTSCTFRVWGFKYSVITAWKKTCFLAVFVYLKWTWWLAEGGWNSTCARRKRWHLSQNHKRLGKSLASFWKGLLSECCKSVVNFMGHFQLGSWSSLCLRCIHAPFCRGWKGASKDQSKDHSKGPQRKERNEGWFQGRFSRRTKRRNGEGKGVEDW